jgi:deoxyadenosine/deoxycytidine kinase
MVLINLVVDGIIGSGKTTLVNDCLYPIFTDMGYRVCIIPEPVDQWQQDGILKKFYEDPKRYAYHFQTKAFLDRVKLCRDIYNEKKDNTDIFILERSIFTDCIFMENLYSSGTVDDMEMKHYREWWNLWRDVIPFHPHYFIYLRPSLDECMNRVRERSRNGEEGISKDYQLDLLKQHDMFFIHKYVQVTDDYRAPVIVIEDNSNFRDSDEVKTDIANLILSKITLM